MDSRSSSTRSPENPLRQEVCQGKSIYFQKHQAMLVNKEEAGYQHALHAWRFAYRPPIPDYLQAATEQQPETPITDKDDNYHINIMKIALNSYNKANGNLDFQFMKGGIRISNIIEFGSAYYHYNFYALSPSRDVFKWFFVEVDADIQGEHGVCVCCSISLDDKEFGKCYGCESNRKIGLLHPNTEDYIAGRKDLWTPMCRYSPYGDDEEDWL